MAHKLVKIDGRLIHDWQSFHKVFAQVMGFPDFYGRNMNAWIDCMSSLDEPEDGMTTVHAPTDGILVLQIEHVDAFATNCPDQFAALVECTAFVNYRRLDVGEAPVLALSFWKRSEG